MTHDWIVSFAACACKISCGDFNFKRFMFAVVLGA